jgi:hypothetical protein
MALKVLGVHVRVHVENGSFEEGHTWRCTNDRRNHLNLVVFGRSQAEVRIRFRKLVEEMVAAGRLSLKDLRRFL